MPKLTLQRQYTWGGTVYGPGEAEVPEAATADLQAREAEYAAYLKEGGTPHPPISAGMDAGAAMIDERIRKPRSQQAPGAAPPPSTLAQERREEDVARERAEAEKARAQERDQAAALVEAERKRAMDAEAEKAAAATNQAKGNKK